MGLLNENGINTITPDKVKCDGWVLQHFPGRGRYLKEAFLALTQAGIPADEIYCQVWIQGRNRIYPQIVDVYKAGIRNIFLYNEFGEGIYSELTQEKISAQCNLWKIDYSKAKREMDRYKHLMESSQKERKNGL